MATAGRVLLFSSLRARRTTRGTRPAIRRAAPAVPRRLAHREPHESGAGCRLDHCRRNEGLWDLLRGGIPSRFHRVLRDAPHRRSDSFQAPWVYLVPGRQPVRRPERRGGVAVRDRLPAQRTSSVAASPQDDRRRRRGNGTWSSASWTMPRLQDLGVSSSPIHGVPSHPSGSRRRSASARGGSPPARCWFARLPDRGDECRPTSPAEAAPVGMVRLARSPSMAGRRCSSPACRCSR